MPFKRVAEDLILTSMKAFEVVVAVIILVATILGLIYQETVKEIMMPILYRIW